MDLDGFLSNKELWDEQAKQAQERREKLLSFGKNTLGVLVQTNDGLFVVDPEDITVSRELLEKGEYNIHELEMLRSFTNKESNVLVVGAHLGTHAIELSKNCKAVTAIEANPHTYTLLKANILLNKRDNVTLHHIAAAECKRKIEFILSTANSGASKRGPLKNPKEAYIYDEPKTIEVEAIDLDTLLDGQSFDFILMDIEGSEYFALQGMQKILSNTKVLCVEYLPHLLKNAAGITPEQFASTILPHYDWMFVPAYNNSITPKHAILNMLQGMYDADCGFDNIYFIKGDLPTQLVPH